MSLEIQQQVATELQRRSTVLPDEVQAWEALTEGNVQGLGIHRSQVARINDMFAELKATQQEALAALDPNLSPDAFAEARMDFESALTGTHSIMAAFRYVLAQRLDPPALPAEVGLQPLATHSYRDELDAADLIAADCYKQCMERANRWNNLSADHLREPPLTLLNAMLSPAAIARGHGFGLLGLKLYEYLEWQLPIPVLSLPLHATVALWTYSSIYHEVGHLLDQDLNLRTDIGAHLQQQLPQNERRADWLQWRGEIIGDVFGVLLGGVGFAYALRSLLFSAEDIVVNIEPGEVHPPAYLRIFLIGALLRRLADLVPQTAQPNPSQELVAVADDIEQAWRQLYGDPPRWIDYRNDCTHVAAILLDAELAGLKNHCLRDFAFDVDHDGGPDLVLDHDHVAKLAKFVRLGHFKPLTVVPHRLVPASAQMAIQKVTANFEQEYANIQQRTLKYCLTDIPRPQFLPGGDTDERREYLKALTRKLTFRSPGSV